MDVVLTKAMQQLHSLSLRPLVRDQEKDRRKHSKAERRLWHEWLRPLVITWLYKAGAAQHFLRTRHIPQLTTVTTECWWQALANIEDRFANKKSWQTWSPSRLMTRKNSTGFRVSLDFASRVLVYCLSVMLNNDPWGNVQFTFIHRVH